jgi:MarR family 2-MHQ and catechol resistance regulon transcriptional repressor
MGRARDGKITAPRLWTVMVRSLHAVRGMAEASIARTELCLSDFAALEALLHKGPLTITELQGKVLLATGSMTAAVDRLEKRGLLARRFSPSDRRVRVVELTEHGKELATSSFKKHAEDLEALMSVFSNEEKELLCGLLKKLGLRAAEKLAGQHTSSHALAENAVS